jgi:hypothetical protein
LDPCSSVAETKFRQGSKSSTTMTEVRLTKRDLPLPIPKSLPRATRQKTHLFLRQHSS